MQRGCLGFMAMVILFVTVFGVRAGCPGPYSGLSLRDSNGVNHQSAKRDPSNRRRPRANLRAALVTNQEDRRKQFQVQQSGVRTLHSKQGLAMIARVQDELADFAEMFSGRARSLLGVQISEWIASFSSRQSGGPQVAIVAE